MKRWTNDEIAVLEAHYGKIPHRELYRLLPGRTKSSVYRRVFRMGMGLDTATAASLGRQGYRKYTFNYAYFSEPNPENSYWAGFIAADGNISSSPTPRLKITLQERDKNQLIRFAESIHFQGPIVHRIIKANGREYPAVVLEMACIDSTVHDLEAHFSVTKRKSLTLKPPSIDQLAHIAAFITGYIDGDGSFDYSRRDRSFRLGIRGTDAILTWVKHWFDTWAPIACPSNISSSDGYPKYQVCGKRLFLLADVLLTHSPHYLARKWQDFIAYRRKE